MSRDAYGKVIHRNFKRSNSNQPLTELLSPHAGTIIQALVGDAVPDMEPGKDGCVSAILGTAVPASTWTALSELHSSSLWMTWDVSRKSERDRRFAIARSPRDNGPTHAHRECATSSWFRVFPHGTKGPAKEEFVPCTLAQPCTAVPKYTD